MGSVFASLAGLARAQTARLSGEAAEFRPMARLGGPNGAASPDTARSSATVVAIFAENADEVFETARGASFAPVPAAGSQLTASFDVGDLDIRAGDRLAREATGEVFSITEKRFDGLGGITCRLAIAVTG